MIITLHGVIPSLKNDKKIIYLWRNGKKVPSIVSSDRAVEWMKTAVPALKLAFRGYRITDYPITVTMTFYLATDHRRDLDNLSSGVLDAMTHAGIVDDDNVKHINRLTLVYGGIDRKNPRVEIEFED